MSNKPIIIGNWKMNKNPQEAIEFLNIFLPLTKKSNLNIDYGIATSYLCLPYILKYNNDLIIASQNCFYQKNGAYTGEISYSMLEAIGVKWSIIGHSERREIFNENNEIINLKVKNILENSKINIILCVGENLSQYNNNLTKKVIITQLESNFKNIDNKFLSRIVIAYEPIWAIGTGKNASPQIAENICAFIRTKIKELYDNKIAENLKIQYGGSVKSENIISYLSQKNINGALVGGASLNPQSFFDIILQSCGDYK